jgi:hypothetical protein
LDELNYDKVIKPIVPLSSEVVEQAMKIGNFIQWERKTGTPIYQQDNLVIRPISRVLTTWWRPYGGSVHNWPVAIEVEENGTIRELPITHINLLAQTGIGLIVILISLFIWLASNRQSKNSSQTLNEEESG